MRKKYSSCSWQYFYFLRDRWSWNGSWNGRWDDRNHEGTGVWMWVTKMNVGEWWTQFYKVHSKLAWKLQRTALHKWSTKWQDGRCEKYVPNIKKHNSVYGKGKKGFRVKIRSCVDGIFELFLLDLAIEKVDKLTKKSIRIRSTQRTYIATEKTRGY